VPFIADILYIDHGLLFIYDSPNPLQIYSNFVKTLFSKNINLLTSYSVNALGRSYLLASTNTGTPLSSSSYSIKSNSYLATSILSLSAESITKMTALVS
jgi:hypothetical protein